MTKKKAESKSKAALVHLSHYCPECLRGLPMRTPTPETVNDPQSVECTCGWTGKIQPFVPATSVVD